MLENNNNAATGGIAILLNSNAYRALYSILMVSKRIMMKISIGTQNKYYCMLHSNKYK